MSPVRTPLPVTPSECKEVAERLRRVDVAAEDVNLVMDAASLLESAGEELKLVLRNRDRLRKNRNNKQRELIDLRHTIGRLHAYLKSNECPLSEGERSELLRILA